MHPAIEIIWLGAVAGAAIAGAAGAAGPPAAAAGALALHPENPHYFVFRGRPAVLVASGEHYGAVLNLDFDYVKYLDALKRDGLNLTRTFSGVYREVPRSFKIKNNPLAPAPGRYICPWARSAEPGYFDGGNKFDLGRWEEAYFRRARDFLAQASARGVVVEFVLFCPMYNAELWKANPMYVANNTSGVGDLKKDEPHTLGNGRLLDFQLAVTRKIVTELNEFDNLYWEICNEPYFGGVTLEWQKRIADAIVQAEAGLPRKHLIAQNIANGSKKIEDPNPAVSIFNFHYCSPPDAVAMNWHLGKVIADDETGFKGSGDTPYAPDGWDFLMAGGAVYSSLDYSFYPGREDGSGTPDAPGGGSARLRRSLAALRAFMESFDFIRMAPDPQVVKAAPPKSTARVLAEKGRQYAAFIRPLKAPAAGGAAPGGATAEGELVLDLPAGPYKADWVNIWTGDVEKTETFDHSGGEKRFTPPPFTDGIALRLKRVEGR